MKQFKSNLNVKLFADGADISTMLSMNELDYIEGLTTNPTLMRKVGVTDYKKFAKSVLKEIRTKPISFEIFSDDFENMKKQALEIGGWAENVYVKIPVTTTNGESTVDLIKYLVNCGIKINVTAVFTVNQVKSLVEVLNPNIPSYVSIFAGRIADTGRDPIEIMENALRLMSLNQNSELIWASPRELLNIFQADQIGCHVITATSDIINKLDLIGKDLTEYSLETVQMFRNDALASGYKI